METIDFGETLLRLGAATLGGAVIGLNRELTHKPAGIRTNALVALGTALVTVLSIEWLATAVPREDGAMTRTIQGIITGIGFIGGGVILKIPAEQTVHGITTASSIWLVAGVGLACGLGAWRAAVAAVVFAMLVLTLGNKVEDAVHRLRGEKEKDGAYGPADDDDD